MYVGGKRNSCDMKVNMMIASRSKIMHDPNEMYVFVRSAHAIVLCLFVGNACCLCSAAYSKFWLDAIKPLHRIIIKFISDAGANRSTHTRCLLWASLHLCSATVCICGGIKVHLLHGPVLMHLSSDYVIQKYIKMDAKERDEGGKTPCRAAEHAKHLILEWEHDGKTYITAKKRESEENHHRAHTIRALYWSLMKNSWRELYHFRVCVYASNTHSQLSLSHSVYMSLCFCHPFFRPFLGF